MPLGVGGELQQELLGLGRGEVLAGEREARGETGDERGGGRPEAARGGILFMDVNFMSSTGSVSSGKIAAWPSRTAAMMALDSSLGSVFSPSP